MSSVQAVFKIIPTTQQYDWGKIGKDSKVAQFASASQIPGFAIDEGSPYAELWMGTHPKSPSHVRSSNQVLSEYLEQHSELIGTPIIEKFDAANGNLPFLFKVLSIAKALSIQTHPDKKTAEQLHVQFPDIYKDPNHKPEMALAITPFQALCGFRPLPEIAAYLNSTPELRSMLPAAIVDEFLKISNSTTPEGGAEKAALKNVFASLMMADEETVKAKVDTLMTRYNSGETHAGEDPDIVKLVLLLGKQFPGDIGIFCAYVLNYVVLRPGEAIFLGAGEPHAYVSGECIECMANSDNVIRAGLTPKLRDVPNLVSGLTYTASPPTKHVVYTKPFRNASRASVLYDPPIPEFSVVRVKIPEGSTKESEVHPPLGGPSVIIVTEGQGQVSWNDDAESLDVSLGDVFFVGAATKVKFTIKGDETFVIYRAFVEAG
ncbi:Mannose-6-phosphate isomerase [Psilocybe cubensis]|uniref:Mannose-6-phosphate isomerase n=2 Tax=Psilocybe cubensis TaxID=181762 RepID=A0ACB8GTZ6_PSICU|nr:Mannose-6-phosphate isomerase [Psilocybe cubensis]KAH9479108.1 Mannose-6-phosphate isomerase [Psilocybe cubensis]